MSWANKLAYFLINFTLIFTVLAYGAVHQPVIALFYIIVAAMLVLWAIEGYLTGTMRYSKSRLQAPLYALAAYGFIQVIPFGSIASTAGVAGIPRTISLDPFATQTTAIHILALCIFFSVSLVFIDSASRLRRVVTVITVFGFIYAFFAILQGVLSPTKIYGIYERQFAQPYGSFVNRHNFAAFMEMTLSLPLGLVFSGAVKRDKRLLFITAISLMGIALLLSGSRGGFVALLAELCLLLILTTNAKSKKSLVLKVALLVALIAAIVGGAIFVGGESSLTRIAETAQSKDITTNRTHIWGVTLNVIAHNLPLGAGLGAFGAAYTPFDTLSGLERVEQAHNDYLQMLADAGIVGLAIGGLFLFLLIKTARQNIRIENDYRRGVAIGAVSGIFAILVHSIFDFVLHTTAISVLFLTLVAILVASGYRYADDIEDTEHRRSHRRRSGSVTKISEARRRTR